MNTKGKYRGSFINSSVGSTVLCGQCFILSINNVHRSVAWSKGKGKLYGELKAVYAEREREREKEREKEENWQQRERRTEFVFVSFYSPAKVFLYKDCSKKNFLNVPTLKLFNALLDIFCV